MIDPIVTFSPPDPKDDKPCLRGNVYTYCKAHCQFLAHDGTKKPGCIFYPRSFAGGMTRTKEQYAKDSKPKARRTEEVVPGFQVWEIEEDLRG